MSFQETERYLELRNLRTSRIDKSLYLGWLRDVESNQFIESARRDYSLSELDAYMDSKLTAPNVEFWGIFVNLDRFIGTVKLDPIDFESGSAWLGIMIGEVDQRGKGYGRSVLQQVSEYALVSLKLKELYLGVHKDNLPALNLYLKQGFEVIEANDFSLVMKKNLISPIEL